MYQFFFVTVYSFVEAPLKMIATFERTQKKYSVAVPAVALHTTQHKRMNMTKRTRNGSESDSNQTHHRHHKEKRTAKTSKSKQAQAQAEPHRIQPTTRPSRIGHSTGRTA